MLSLLWAAADAICRCGRECYGSAEEVTTVIFAFAPIRTIYRISNRDGEGFENKLAEIVAADLGKPILRLVGAAARLYSQHVERG